MIDLSFNYGLLVCFIERSLRGRVFPAKVAFETIRSTFDAERNIERQRRTTKRATTHFDLHVNKDSFRPYETLISILQDILFKEHLFLYLIFSFMV